MAFGLRGIKLKLTLAVVLGVALTAIALTVVTNVLVAMTFDLSLTERSEATGKVLTQALATPTRQLRSNVDVLLLDPQFQQDLTLSSWDHMTTALDKLRENTRCAGIAIVYLKQEVAHSTGAGITSAALLKSTALTHAEATGKTVSTVESLDGNTLQLIASPIILLEQTVGYAVAANVIDAKLLAELKASTDAEVILVRDGKVVAGTCPLDDGRVVQGLEGRLRGDGMILVEGFRSGGAPLLAAALPLRNDGKLQATLVFALSAKEATAIRRRVTSASLGLALLITLICGLLGLVVARRISDPIVEIEQGFRAIAASGDLSRRITKSYPDEVGRMAESFNQMQGQIESLHQRVVTAEERMRSELQMASAVQEMLFPPTSIEGARCVIASYAQTSTETGGDWHTVIHSPETHSSTIILADVTGHGAAAALVTAILHGFINAVRSEIAHAGGDAWESTITRLLLGLNQTIIESTRRSLVLTLCVFAFDHRTLSARFLNAGHLGPLIMKPQPNGASLVSMLPLPPSSLVGDIDTPNFIVRDIQFEPGQAFFLYTDGLVECANAAEDQFGLKRLRALLAKSGHLDPRSMRDSIHSECAAFYGGVPLADDITFVVGRVR